MTMCNCFRCGARAICEQVGTDHKGFSVFLCHACQDCDYCEKPTKGGLTERRLSDADGPSDDSIWLCSPCNLRNPA